MVVNVDSFPSSEHSSGSVQCQVGVVADNCPIFSYVYALSWPLNSQARVD